MKNKRLTRSVYLLNNKTKEPSNKSSNYEWLKITSQFIILITSLHYFLSFKWLYKLLKPYNVNLSSTISIEDLKYDFVAHNWSIIFPSLLGLVWIIATKLIIPKNTYENLGKKSKEGAKKNWQLIKDFCKDALQAQLFFSYLILIVLGSIYYFNQPQVEIKLDNYLIWLLIALSFVIPMLYLFLSSKREFISLIYFTLIFLWANAAIEDIFIKSESRKVRDKTTYEVEFEFKDRKVKSSPTLQFIYRGSKSVIMLDILNDSTIQSFPSKYIGQFNFKES